MSHLHQFIIHLSLHVHFPHVWMIAKVVCQRAVMSLCVRCIPYIGATARVVQFTAKKPNGSVWVARWCRTAPAMAIPSYVEVPRPSSAESAVARINPLDTAHHRE